MLDKENSMLKNIVFMIFSFMGILFTLYFDNVFYHICIIWALAVLAMYLVNFDLLHPYCWFSGSFALYSSAYAIICYYYPFDSIGYKTDNLLLSLVAMSSFLLTIGCRIVDNTNVTSFYISEDENNVKKIKLLLKIIALIMLVSEFQLLGTDYSHKNEMLADRNIFFLIGAYGARFFSFYFIIDTILSYKKSLKKVLPGIIFYSIIILLFSLFTGERDAIFRHILIMVLVLWSMKIIGRFELLYIIPTGIIGMILISYFKYYFVSGVVAETYSLTTGDILYSFLNADFAENGRNIQVLINQLWTNGSQNYFLFITDMFTPFFPSNTFFNVAEWFNDTFYAGSYSRAFSLVGEGYLIGGYLGVIILFVLNGCLVKFIYNNCNKNIWWFASYIYIITLVIMSFRSSLGTIFIGLFRIIGVALLFAFFVKRIRWRC